MIRLKRLLLMLLIALAVPAQGMAAAAAGICMTFGHHDAPVAHAHDSGKYGYVADSKGMTSPDERGAHCGPCVACCGTVASISAVVVPGTDLAASARVQVHTDEEPAWMLPSALDRPPLAL